MAREPHAHYEGVDLVDEPGGDWNSFVYAGDPDRNGRILRERPARDQANVTGDDTNAGQQPAPSDYDDNPNRMRLARSVLRRHAAAGDVHELVARRFVAEGLARVLDVGCGEGELARYLPDGAWVGLDNSQTMLERAPAGGVLGAATALPFADESFDGVAPGLTAVPFSCSQPPSVCSSAS